MSRNAAAGRFGLLSALRRHPLLVLSSAIVLGLLGAGVGTVLPVSYAATAHLVVAVPDRIVGSAENGDLPEEGAQRAAEAVLGPAVTQLAGDRAPGNPDPQDVAAALDVVPSRDSGVVSITASASTPDGAGALANAVGEAYLQLAAADRVERYAGRIERLVAERQTLQAQLAEAWGAYARRVAAVRTRTGASSTISVVLGADPLLQQLRDNGGRLAEQLATVERSIVDAEASSALAPIERQELVRAGEPSAARGSMVRRSAAVAVPVGVLLGAALAWRRVEREGTTPRDLAPGYRFLGRLPAPRRRPHGQADAETAGLWRHLRLVATAQHLDDLIVHELPSRPWSRGAAQPLLDAARADGCLVSEDGDGTRRRDGLARNGSPAPGSGSLRVVRTSSTAVLSSVGDPRLTGVVVVGAPSASFARDVRAVETLVTAAGADFLGVLVGGAARPLGRFRPRPADAGAPASATTPGEGGTGAR